MFDTYPVMSAAFRAALLERGIDEPAETVMSFFKVSMFYAVQSYTEKYRLDNEFFERYKALSKAAERENARPFDGVAELCRTICESGGKNYLFTHRGGSARYFFDKFDLSGYFTELITHERDFPRKPSPEGILYLIGKYGFAPDDALMVGDRDLDIQAAQGAGAKGCFFADGGEASGIADYNIDSLPELYEIIAIN